ncbi:extracellular solute-binding protein [Acetatifactor aquisgranensis]|jgi:ABC-type sugar transport system, periplasmic component|uniref:extracellular solute-binding protein n=1 Tax=Acetatifactor aquisgranensis TaxID=2941233 RepID=UPI00203DE4CE|nr:extracellular solute-binding protein [Acetatifactor aquisgranensis]MCI8542649.1 extracellular solute-binding protein [Lachnospiraceae bacterium]
MKKKYLQKVLAVAMTGAMALGVLAGCGSEPASSGNESSAPSSQEESSEEEAPEESSAEESSAEESSEAPAGTAGIDGWEPFAERVTLKIPVYDRGDAGNGCSDVVNNYWTNWVQENFGEKYNIDVEYVAITRTAVMNDYAMLAAGQDLPTICMEYDYDKLATWQAEGYLQPYDVEQFKTIAPTYWQTMADNGNDAYTKLAGEDYLMLGYRPYGNSTYTFVTWYRKDWMKEAGFEEYPKTNTELLELYAKLVENGHEYPLSGSKVAGAGVDQNYGYRDYPQDEEIWATTGDYQIPALSTEAQKRYLKWENMLYNEGYKNPEYYLREASEAEADFINGKAFSWAGYVSSTMTQLNSFYENFPDAELGVIVCPDTFIQDETWGSSNAYRPGTNFGMMIALSNSATEDEAKAAMMYLEWMAQEENLFTMTWGEEGVNFNYDEDGNPVAVGDQSGLEQQQGHNNNVDYWCAVTAIKTLGSIEKDIAAINPQGLPQDFYDELLANYNGQVSIWNEGYANSDCLFAVSLESVAEYGNTLFDLYAEYRDQLTMCDPEEFDELYDELSQKYLDQGYQEVIDERKAAFESGQTTKLQ